MARFTLPRDIYYGSGAIDELKNLKGYKKAMILTGGSSMKRGGFLQKVEDILHEIGVETQLFEGIEPDRRRFTYRCGESHVGLLRAPRSNI